MSIEMLSNNMSCGWLAALLEYVSLWVCNFLFLVLFMPWQTFLIQDYICWMPFKSLPIVCLSWEVLIFCILVAKVVLAAQGLREQYNCELGNCSITTVYDWFYYACFFYWVQYHSDIKNVEIVIFFFTHKNIGNNRLFFLTFWCIWLNSLYSHV